MERLLEGKDSPSTPVEATLVRRPRCTPKDPRTETTTGTLRTPNVRHSTALEYDPFRTLVGPGGQTRSKRTTGQTGSRNEKASLKSEPLRSDTSRTTRTPTALQPRHLVRPLFTRTLLRFYPGSGVCTVETHGSVKMKESRHQSPKVLSRICIKHCK